MATITIIDDQGNQQQVASDVDVTDHVNIHCPCEGDQSPDGNTYVEVTVYNSTGVIISGPTTQTWAIDPDASPHDYMVDGEENSTAAMAPAEDKWIDMLPADHEVVA